MKDRGMVKWAPYKSLIEQEDFMGNMKKKRQRIEKPLNLEEKSEEIDMLLRQYHGQKVVVSYYEDGFIEKISGTIDLIDTTYKFVLVNGDRLYLRNIIDIKD